MEQLPSQPLNPMPSRPMNPAPVRPSIPTPPVQNVNPVKLASSKIGGIIIKIIGIIIVLGIIAGGAMLASGFWDPIWSPFRPNPEQIINAMAQNMLTVKSSHSEGKININANGPTSAVIAVNFNVNGDANDITNVKSEGDFGISLSGDMISSAGGDISAKLKMKMIGQDGYLNITEFNAPSLGFILAMMGIDTNNIIGSWVKLPSADSLAQGNLIGMPTPAETTAIVERMRKDLSDALSSNTFYIVKEQLPNQIIDGQKIYRYSVALNNEKAAQLIGDLMLEQVGIYDIDLSSNKAEIKAEISSAFLEGLNKIGEIRAELAIGSKDKYLYGFKMSKNVDASKINEGVTGTIDISLEVNNSLFNKPVVVEAPATYRTFEEVFPFAPPVTVNP